MKDLLSRYPVHKTAVANTHITAEQYQSLYQQSIEQPDTFWAEQASQFLDWFEPWQEVSSVDFKTADISWFKGGKLNASYNCIDRHLTTKANDIAMIFEGDEPDDDLSVTYQELHDNVCRFANLLKARGVKKGDRVCIYMPMIPEVGYAMLACARIGAIHSIVFGGFSTESIKARILDADCQVVITADEGVRGGKIIPLKANVDEAIKGCPNVHSVVMIERTGNEVSWNEQIDVAYTDIILNYPATCEPERMDAEDPLFILYTSGSTGKPKGVLHTTGGYLLYAAMTHKYVFDYQDGEVFWCTADAGWITGHSYIFYGPLANGATTLVFEGVPTYPDAGRFWQVCEKHGVNVFYTAPTAIRALMSLGDELVERHDRSSIRLLGSVGEPINPEAWHWYYEVVGESRCPIVDTWWQTETGGILITSLPGSADMKPGSAGLPFFGVKPALLNRDGEELDGVAKGALTLTGSWPGQMRSVYGDHQRFYDTYFSQYAGYYFTGDGAKRDEDGYYCITGRIDDVLNVSGHRLGTAEIESALVLHPAVAEAAVVGYPHEIKGQGVYCFITLMNSVEGSESLIDELKLFVADELGKFARPDYLQYAPGLPKTRSGKIMRRILRKIAENELDNLGDTSTLADPSVVEHLIENRIIHE
ncbi:acetyl-coenzyme A synthetase 2 [Thalassotalea loyana]|uniref:Acetyl-coenzyme A synthetase n=1 Tax=Thalassotalea loyana TaxID=280483 RepID=A0ABQ6H8I9_9GAMM|nr:acetate--CoA ligase [Thalassotalea loyana]GLX84446.1 acetyl-coenzyme A synthetase 2 [Thalassotalea loyana]